MRKTFLILLVMGFAAPVGADSAERPFKGSIVGESTFPFVGFDICPQSDLFWGGLRTEGSATGTASHMGKVEMTSQHCTPAGAEITGGAMTLVAANGDEVYVEYSGLTPGPIPGVGEVIVVDIDFEIVGGSGRFADAEGGGSMTAYVVFEGFGDPSWASTWVWEGTIGY
jgi:hypothetical protein